MINIGSGEEVTIKELANTIKKIVGYNGEIVFDDNYPDGTYRKRLDLSKIENLNLKCEILLEKGLNIVYNDFKERKQQCLEWHI